MTWYEINFLAALMFVLSLVAWRIGYIMGEREENRRWRFTSTTQNREMLNQHGRDFVVMERREFWKDWHDPLIRCRKGMKP